MERIDSLHPDLEKLYPTAALLLKDQAGPLQVKPTGYQQRICRLSGIRAIVFDIYGTLFISGSGDIGVNGLNLSEKAFYSALEDSGIKVTGQALSPDTAGSLSALIKADHQEHRLQGIEYPEVDIIRIWDLVLQKLSDSGIISYDRSLDTVVEVAVRYERAVNPVWPMPFAKEILAELRDSGLALGIVSNAQFFTPLLFPAFLGRSFRDSGFQEDLCVWSYLYGKAKPSHELFDVISTVLAQKYSIATEETVFIGNDMLNDIAAAHSAGFRTILFAGDSRSLRLREDNSRCSGLRPDSVITGLDQIPEVIF